MRAPLPEPSTRWTLETPLATVSLGADGVVYARSRPLPQTLPAALSSLRVAAGLLQEARVVLVVDMRATSALPAEVQQLYARAVTERLAALALVVSGPLNRVTANLLVARFGIQGVRVPMRIFTDAEAAAVWARGLVPGGPRGLQAAPALGTVEPAPPQPRALPQA